MLTGTSLQIPSVLTVISKCWEQAEAELRRLIETRHHDLDEEVITVLCYGELRHVLSQASEHGEVERAFRDDLLRTFPTLIWGHVDFRPIYEGLIAEVSMHPRYVETKTGADFGLSITRPEVKATLRGIEIEDMGHERGLLCQAKVRRRNGQWGSLTRNQRKILKDRTEYLALCLYDYADADADRKLLKPFQWQSCGGHSIAEVESWARTDAFPHPRSSTQLLTDLGSDRIGTAARDVLRSLVHPEQHTGRIPCFEIRVTWRDGWRLPRDPIRTHHTENMQQRQYL